MSIDGLFFLSCAADRLVSGDEIAGIKKVMATANGENSGLPFGYDEAVDQRSWDDLKSLFAEIFRPPGRKYRARPSAGAPFLDGCRSRTERIPRNPPAAPRLPGDSRLLPALDEHCELPGRRGDLDRLHRVVGGCRLVGDAFSVEESPGGCGGRGALFVDRWLCRGCPGLPLLSQALCLGELSRCQPRRDPVSRTDGLLAKILVRRRGAGGDEFVLLVRLNEILGDASAIFVHEPEIVLSADVALLRGSAVPP